MRVAHIDPFSGASGDMLLGALLDAGVRLEDLLPLLSGLGLDGWSLRTETVFRGGIAATGVKVTAEDRQPQRRWAEIRELLARTPLPDMVRRRALGAFERLAAAEARIHGVPTDAVVFHELGSLDTIIDIVGVSAGFHRLGVERVTSGPVAQGHGWVHSAHGALPVPAPATLEILRDAPVIGVEEDAELCTPTGAALLAEWADAWGALPAMTLQATGYGAGARDLRRPNLLRIVVGYSEGGSDTETLVVLEATIDDMPGELTPVVLDALRAAGARDAWARPVLMKKGRPGVEVVCLTEPGTLDAVRTALFRHSTTLGVREYEVLRTALEREVATVTVEGQAVRVKLGRLDGRVVNVAPEFDDCATAAEATRLPVKTVVELARAAWLGRKDA